MFVELKIVMDYRGLSVKDCVPVQGSCCSIYHDFSAAFVEKSTEHPSRFLRPLGSRSFPCAIGISHTLLTLMGDKSNDLWESRTKGSMDRIAVFL